MNFIEEVLIVLAYSTKTQLAIFFGIIFFFVTLALGHHFASTLVFHGMMAPLADTFRPIIEHRYEKAAWVILGSFLLLAYKCFKKDRKRLLGL